jgi:mannose-1-phosphate guanylyltransferase
MDRSKPKSARTPSNHTVEKHLLCGLVLAGGEGQRLQPLIRRLRGDSLPKQYVNFTGTRSMLEHTYRRVERVIPRERVFTVINQTHLSYPDVNRQLRRRREGTVIVQPENKETLPGLLLPLTHIHRRYPNAVVAVFPSDQFVQGEDELMRQIRSAQNIVTHHPSKLVLLGVEPEYAECEYGYILPRRGSDTNGWGGYDVSHFVEKPDIMQVHDLIGRGALWNTMLMVFGVAQMLNWVNALKPDLHHRFDRIRKSIGTALEPTAVREVYDHLEPLNFSKDVLEPIVREHPSCLSVLPVSHVLWSDWGTETRIVNTLNRIGAAHALNNLSQNVSMRREGKRVRRHGLDRAASVEL